MAEDFQEGTFFHAVTGEELCIQFDGNTVFMTLYDHNGKAASKTIFDMSKKTPDEVAQILSQYDRTPKKKKS